MTQFWTGRKRSRAQAKKALATKRARGTVIGWPKGKPNPMARQQAISSSGVGGIRPDLNEYFRSRWEANFARYLRFIRLSYVYEPAVFVIDVLSGASYAYRPDFLVDDRLFVEIKGFDRSGRPMLEILEAAKVQLPKPLIVIGRSEYEIFQRSVAAFIPEWEYEFSARPDRPKRFCRCGRELKRNQKRYCSRACQQPYLGCRRPPEANAKMVATRRAKFGGAYSPAGRSMTL